LVVQTRARPIEGEANDAIVKMVATAFGTSKSKVHIVRGEKSKRKTVHVYLELTKEKNEKFFLQKITSALMDEA
jgi:uncharacterized protein YggU (UPF0235/DUF167 family)